MQTDDRMNERDGAEGKDELASPTRDCEGKVTHEGGKREAEKVSCLVFRHSLVCGTHM